METVKSISVRIGARKSLLSRAQFEEVKKELISFHPHIFLEPVFIETQGDKNLDVSLRQMDRTDFFTKELDEMVLDGTLHAAVHSAKDLPDPLKEGLCVAAMTQGVDSKDVLLLRETETVQSLPNGALIATSSERREKAALSIRSDFRFCDLRGTIETRISKLNAKECDGIIIAEAALIRLGLTHLNRVDLPGETAQNQGRLAVIVRCDNQQMKNLFFTIDLTSI